MILIWFYSLYEILIFSGENDLVHQLDFSQHDAMQNFQISPSIELHHFLNQFSEIIISKPFFHEMFSTDEPFNSLRFPLPHPWKNYLAAD